MSSQSRQNQVELNSSPEARRCEGCLDSRDEFSLFGRFREEGPAGAGVAGALAAIGRSEAFAGGGCVAADDDHGARAHVFFLAHDVLDFRSAGSSRRL
ncbi:MAG: hypothetical protein QM757_13620 [Paludibaculum sp.]